MTGGLIQLVAYGSQDIYLTGNPQITFFKTVYRRHTNFAIETIETPFNGNINFGNRLWVKFSKTGDLLSRMYLKLTVSCVDPHGSKFAWVHRLGHALVGYVHVTIGGTVVDRQYGVWLDIWYELARQGDHERGYAHMVGDIPEMTDYNSCIKPEYTMFVPLQFWFNRYIGLAIPMIAIQYQDVVIDYQVQCLDRLIVRDCKFNPCEITLKEASLLTDFVYLDSDERRRFAIVGHEYLVEQLQYYGTEPVQFDVVRYKLDFTAPTKELLWAWNNGNYISGKQFVYYPENNKWCIKDAAKNIVFNSISIGVDPSELVGGDWSKIPALSIGSVGTFNIKNQSRESIWVNPNSLSIGLYGITNKILADITITSDNQICVDYIETSLTIRDISFPVCTMIDTRVNVCDPIVMQFGNYGILIDGTFNPVQFGLLQFNGQDRFDKREGAFFNYVQPDQCHSNTPRDGVNVYSFALYPEQHQPSGTANLSRIDSTDLTLWFCDDTRICNEAPDLPFLNDLNVIHIFATNYNILRVMAGVSGLAYSVQ